MNDQRTELSKLARRTVKKTETILTEFEETVAGQQDLESGMANILRDMRSLLLFSERKLKEAKGNIAALREKINKVLAILRVFKGMVKAAKEKGQEVSRSTNTQNILGGIFCDIKNGVDGYSKSGDGTSSLIISLVGGITRLTGGIMKAVNRPIFGSMLSRALGKINDAISIVTKQKDVMQREVERIIVWKDAVDVLQVDLNSKGEERELFNEIKEIIEDGDVEEIYEVFKSLKYAAQNYLTEIRNVCRTC